jgi:hypothetical protein
MNMNIGGALSPFSTSTLSPPFDEVDKELQRFAGAVAQQLDSESDVIATEVAMGLAKLAEAKAFFENAARMHGRLARGETLEPVEHVATARAAKVKR